MQRKYFISLNSYVHRKFSQIIEKSMNEKITKQHSMKEALIPNIRQNLDYAAETKQA